MAILWRRGLERLDHGPAPPIVRPMSDPDTKISKDTLAEPAQAKPASGPDVIGGYLKMLPTTPGVYRMLDETGSVLYVGKARSLKTRVSSYARLTGHSNRIARMISTTVAMEFITVATEAEALLLEANLIKRFKPPFNVLMRDDKSLPFILIARDHAAPQLSKHRGARNRKGEYFGPFAAAVAVGRAITMLQRAFQLRTCADSYYENRTRPCLLHQIKRCSAPCTGEISLPDYNKLVDEAVRCMRGESKHVRDMYQRLMSEAADRQEFEEAAKFRNRLWALAHVTADQTINPEGVEEADVFAAHQEGGQTCIQVFFFRTGQNWGNRAYYPKADRALPVEEVLDSFIAQFYDDKPVPRLILLSHDVPSHDVLVEALSIKAEYKIEIRVPARGTKSALVDHALTNAREALGRKLAESSSQARLLEALRERFELEKTPRRVEVFDNSHISGSNAVGGMIVAGPDGFVKGQYRKFNIKSADLTPGDDYAMMREVLMRRFKRIAAETPPPHAEGVSSTRPEEGLGVGGIPIVDTGDSPPPGLPHVQAELGSAKTEGGVYEPEFPTRPDLVFVDGGLGQLSVAREVMRELGISDIALIGVAKGPDRDAGREHFHIPGRERPMMLESKDPVLYFVQRLRDEAHRFAIGAHRAKRSKALSANPLDDIGGIGPTRKRALLVHFGSAKAVSRAGVEDLKTVEGISQELAQKIYDFFHERGG